MTKTTFRSIATALTLTVTMALAGAAQAGDHNRGNHAADAFAAIFQGIGNAIAQQQHVQQQNAYNQGNAGHGQQPGTSGRARPGNGQGGHPPVGGQQLRQMLAGNSVTGILEDGTQFCEFYDYNGQIRGVDFEYYSGSWSVSGPIVHYDYPGFADDGAYQIAADFNSPWIQFYEQNGYQPFHKTRVHRGNVCGT